MTDPVNLPKLDRLLANAMARISHKPDSFEHIRGAVRDAMVNAVRRDRARAVRAARRSNWGSGDWPSGESLLEAIRCINGSDDLDTDEAY